jgi:hypothetical protein
VLLPAALLGLAALIAAAFRRQINLLADGRPAPGVVTRVRRVPNSHGGHSTIVYYQFQTFSGGMEKGRSHSSGRTPKTGDPVCILYEPDDLRHSAVYPLPLVRIA